MIRAILFDYNGVIVNDEPLHLKAYRDLLQSEGIALTDDDVLNGRTFEDGIGRYGSVMDVHDKSGKKSA